MPMPPVDVSVVIPCYNQGRFLHEPLESVLRQRALTPGNAPPRVQILVVNDGSTDQTRQVALRYEKNITYLETKNAGVSAARNLGLLESRGAFLHFLDADDWIAPDFYALMLAAASQAPQVGLFYGSCQLTQEDRTPAWLRKAEPLPAGNPLHVWLTRCHIACHTAFLRRDALARTGAWNPSFPTTQDWDLWIRLAASGVRFQPVPDACAMYRRYDDSVSRDFEKTMLYGTRMLRSHALHHGKCAHCRRAIREGLRYFSGYCLQSAYWHSFGRHRRAGGVAAAARFVARTCWQQPRLALEVARHTRERWLPGPTPKPSPAPSAASAVRA